MRKKEGSAEERERPRPLISWDLHSIAEKTRRERVVEVQPFKPIESIDAETKPQTDRAL